MSKKGRAKNKPTPTLANSGCQSLLEMVLLALEMLVASQGLRITEKITQPICTFIWIGIGLDYV